MHLVIDIDDMPEVVCRVATPTKVFMAGDALMQSWLRDSLEGRRADP